MAAAAVYGTVFKVTTNGTLTTLVSFNCTNGANPHAALTLGNDGNFYGTTANGGSSSSIDGTVFKVTTNGTLTTLVSFNGSQWGESACRADAGQRRQFLRHDFCRRQRRLWDGVPE